VQAVVAVGPVLQTEHLPVLQEAEAMHVLAVGAYVAWSQPHRTCHITTAISELHHT
jgi:hypothetical protein